MRSSNDHAGRRPRTRATPLTTAMLLLLLACGGGGGTGPNDGGMTAVPPPRPRTVDATPSLAFSPPSLTVAAGETVTFAFGSVGHNVFFDAQPGAPANIEGTNAGVSVQRAFATPGTYGYTCHIHPFMHGTVVVQAADVGGANPGGY